MFQSSAAGTRCEDKKENSAFQWLPYVAKTLATLMNILAQVMRPDVMCGFKRKAKTPQRNDTVSYVPEDQSSHNQTLSGELNDVGL